MNWLRKAYSKREDAHQEKVLRYARLMDRIKARASTCKGFLRTPWWSSGEGIEQSASRRVSTHRALGGSGKLLCRAVLRDVARVF